MDNDGAAESNLNVGFGAKTVDPFSPPRVKNSISDWNEFGLVSPIVGNESRTEVEIPQSKLALVSSPPLSHFGETDGGDPVDDSGTRSAFQDHVRACDLLQTSSRYVRNSSRTGVGNSFTPRSHSPLSSASVTMDVVDVDARVSDRPGRGFRKVSDQDQRAQLRFSPPNIRPRVDKVEKQEDLRELPETAPVEMSANHPSLSPRSLPSDSDVPTCSPTAGSLSPRTEVLSGSRFSAQVRDYTGITSALRWSLRPDGLNEMISEKSSVCMGVADGCQHNGRLSVAPADDLDGGEQELCWAGWMEPFTQAGPYQNLDAHRSRRSSPSCSAPGSCTEADVDASSHALLAGSCSTTPPRSRYPYLSSDRRPAFPSLPRRHAKDRTMGDILSPGSRSRLRVPRQTPMPDPPKTITSPFSPKPLEEVSYTYDAGASPDNTQLNTNTNTPWLIQTHEHVRSDTKGFDVLRFSPSSPSTLISWSVSSPVSPPGNLHLDQDKFGGDKDSGHRCSGSGFNKSLTPSGEQRRDMRIEMKPDLDMSTGFNGDSDGAVLTRDALRRPLTAKSINNLGDGDVNGLGHAAGIERRDMGASESFGLLAFNRCRPASPISGSVSVAGASGVSAVGSQFTLGVRSHTNDEDADFQERPSPDSRTTSTHSLSIGRREGGEGELEECGLLKSLLESSDPWGLMKKKVMNLPSPTPEEIEKRGEGGKEDLVRVRGSFGRRGVGYVTPPSMDTLLAIGTSGGAEMKEVGKGGPGDGELEDPQEILDFPPFQFHTGSLVDF